MPRIQKYGAHGTLGSINMIVVIQSLRERDRPTGELLHKVIDEVALPYGKNLEVHYKTAGSADELEFLLQELDAYVYRTGRAPCLHIECHGGPKGIQLSDDSTMAWSRLKPLLVNINRTSRMNLLLVLACCDGGYFSTECRYDETAPFCFMIGPAQSIDEDPLFDLTAALYRQLLKCRDVTDALTAGGAGRDDISFVGLSAVGIFRIALKKRIKDTPVPRRMIEQPIFDQFRRKFFELDEFPENADRFAITYADVRAEVETGDMA